MKHLLTTLPILSRYTIIGGVRKNIPLSDPLEYKPPSDRIKSDTASDESYEANRSKPCTEEGCVTKRHTNKHGKCIATKCTDHHLAAQSRYKRERRALLVNKRRN